MRTLSKSKLLAFRQCPKRLWLEVHRPELREVDLTRFNRHLFAFSPSQVTPSNVGIRPVGTTWRLLGRKT